MIKVANLNKSFAKNHVLRDISTQVAKGEVVVVIGPSGSGKSTFLRCLNLLETPDSGSILFDGQEITAPKTDVYKRQGHNIVLKRRRSVCCVVFLLYRKPAID